ncbi:MAG: bifunctional nuclease family protein [Phycisphaerales bacterium]|nr:MAG: bifunctional nuclease family protein [Phycisphaerales bacterium]
MTDMQIIELSEIDGDRTFPIVIGLPEAFAIERRLKGIEIPRPQTHDLLASVIEHLGGELREIVINDLTGGTFFAKLIIDRDGEEIEVDSRPSDAIALGVAQGVPIFVAEHVLEQTEADEDLGEGYGFDPDEGEESGLDWE